MQKKSEKPPKPGPKEDRLILEGPWEERVKEALEKKRPREGWPKRGQQKPTNRKTEKTD